MNRAALLFLFLLTSSTLAEDPRVTALLVQGDGEERQQRTSTALATFRQAEAIEPQNLGVLLRISKQYTDLADAAKPRSAGRASAEKALEYARRSVALGESNAKAHLNLAICYGKMTDFVGSKEKIEYSKLIRDETQRSIKLDPTDDFAWHVLGRWHSGISNVGSVMKALARLAYGGLPEASNEEAARCLKKATELAPQRIIHRAELAKIYRAIGKNDLAAQEWQNVLGMKAVDGEDANYQKEAKAALAELQPRGRGSRMLSVGRAPRQ